MEKEISSISETTVVNKIYLIRGLKVMLSYDLADLYQVQTKVLNQQVKRNIGRFPARYMFRLSTEEYKKALRSQIVTLKRGQHSKYSPFAFTEHGILMLSSPASTGVMLFYLILKRLKLLIDSLAFFYQ